MCLLVRVNMEEILQANLNVVLNVVLIVVPIAIALVLKNT